MTMTLHLGVIDVPYIAGTVAPRRTVVRRNRKTGQETSFTAAPSGHQTTGDVASILEDKYEVMGTFAEEIGPHIADAIANSMAGAIENLMMGAPSDGDPFGTATGEIEQAFKLFLDQKEMDGRDGVPTQASLDGVNHRLKIKKGDPRPSFIDTGLYQSSFKAWVD